MFGKNDKLASIADAVKQIVEASPVKLQTSTGTKVLGTRYGNSAKAHRDQTSDPFAGHKGPSKKDLEKIEKPEKKEESFSYFTKKLLNTFQEDKEVQKQIDEVLKKDASAGDWIHDFIHSDNPKFAGKSKAERKKMALGAYYSKQNEEVSADLELDRKKDEAEDTPARNSIKAKPTEKDQKIDNFDTKHGQPNAFSHCESVTSFKKFTEALIGNQKKIDKNHNNKIDAQDFKILRAQKKANEETVDEILNPANKTIDTLAGRSKKVPKDAQMDNGNVSTKTELKVEGKGPEQDNVPFEGPYNSTSSPATTTDKSGAKHTPMSRARHLAQTALKRVKSDLKTN
jgi:hypothetical protein